MGGDDMKERIKKFYEKLTKTHENKDKKAEKNRVVFTKVMKSTKFIIRHSAKDVIYDASNFIERNTDSISTSLVELIQEQSSETIGKIYAMKTDYDVEEEDLDPRARKVKAAPKTIWGKFSL
jgi:myosin heavy subunit